MASKIPERLIPPSISAEELEHFGDLCDEIENRADAGDELPGLLAEWNQRAGRAFELLEFTTYCEAMDKEEFVKQALMPKPEKLDDLQFDEACAVVDAIVNAAVSVSETSYLLGLLEANFPAIGVSDLLFWPGEWFGKEPLDVELSSEQLVGYAMARSGRQLAGAPDDLDLPLAIPASIQLPPGP